MIKHESWGVFRNSSQRQSGRNKFIAGSAGLFGVAVLLVCCLLAPGASAQLYTGSVSGTVTDPSGAAIPSAHITLTDVAKGFTFTATTDAVGHYLLRQVAPGRYTISAESPSFQTERKEGVTLDVNQNISLDFSLKLGTTNVVVEVQAGAVHLETEDAVTGQVVNRKFVNDLPLIDRDFFNLATLAPGITETNVGGGGPINFNSNGSRNSTADVLIDGASATNFEQNSGIQSVPYTPSVDSVEEFKVQQTNFTAEFGFAGGTVINVVTRSGSNQFHGNVYEFFRNSVMDANEWFANANGNPIPPLKRNNFGGTFGGPIRKDKTFFFFDYEGIREKTFASRRSGVPTLCERGAGPCPNYGGPIQNKVGNFSELCTLQNGTFNSSGLCSVAAGQLWDPYSGVFNSDPAGDGSINPGAVRSTFIPFNDMANFASAGNSQLAGTKFQPTAGVPGNLIDPVAANLFALYPMPTSAAASLDDLQNNNFSTTGTNGNSNNQWDLKIDHRFSENDLLSIKYSQGSSHSTSFNCYKNFADPCTGGPSESTRHLLTINNTHTFSPTVALTISYGYVRGFDFSHGVGGEFPNLDASFASLGLPSYLNHGFKTIPVIEVGGGYNAGIGSQAFAILREGQDSHHLGGAVSWLRGKHELKFGGEGRLHRINFVQPGWPSGDFAFNRASTSQISSVADSGTGGDGLASFLTGVGDPRNSGGGCTPCQVGLINYVSTQSFRYAAFAQDNYRVTHKLTLNLGLRYELSTPRTERFNRMNWLDPTAPSPLANSPLGALKGAEVFASSKDRSNYYTDYKAIQPRFGFAYQLPHTFVARGGYGIYFSTPRSGASGTGPWGFQGFDVQPPWLTTLNIDHATPYNTLKDTSCLFSDSTSCGVAPPPGSALGAFNDIGFAAVGPVRSISKNIPYEQAWSFGFQKELPGKMLFDASYVGKKGTHLYLGGFREMNILPASAIAGLTPNQIGQLNNNVANPFFFDASLFPKGAACDNTKYICDPTSGLAGPTVSQVQLLLPHPQYAGFQGDSPPIANSIYHALQVRVERDFSEGLQFLMTYTWSKSIDDASATDDSVSWLGGGTTGGSTIAVQNPYNLRGERAVSVYNIPQVLQFSYVYELPVGRGRRLGHDMKPIVNAIVGGWQTNGIIRIDNGRPIIPGLDSSNPIPTFGARPNLTGTLLRGSGSPQQSANTNANPLNYFANPDALSQPLDNSFGSASRTIASVRQPGARDVSMSLFKDFPLGILHEGAHLQFRAESFNTFNHAHFAGPNANVGASDYGVISGTINSPRELQLALKLYF